MPAHLLSALLVAWALLAAPALVAAPPGAAWYFTEAPQVGRSRWPTHLYRDAQWEILTDLKHSRLIYRDRIAGAPWQASPLAFNQPHSVERFPGGTFIVADTDHHRIVMFRSPADAAGVVLDTLAGHATLRPHDTVLNPADGYVYIIDSFRRLYRIDETGQTQEAWQFGPDVVDYARSLSWFDGSIHLINSADGDVLRIDSFERREYTRLPSFGKKARAPAGAFSKTGLILNDVEKAGGWYYATNYFCPSYAGESDPGPLRLLRWRNWEDFAAGRWEDLSSLLPETMVPYYLTADASGLYVPVFDHENDSARDGVLHLLP